MTRIGFDDNNNDNPYQCCKSCGKKLSLFEVIYYQGNYCTTCAIRRLSK